MIRRESWVCLYVLIMAPVFYFYFRFADKIIDALGNWFFFIVPGLAFLGFIMCIINWCIADDQA